MKRIIQFLSHVFNVYKLNLYRINTKLPPPYSLCPSDDSLEIVGITYANCELTKVVNNELQGDFKRMLDDGDEGVFVYVGGHPVGYAWLKKDGSKDPFFTFYNCCYLCRCFVHPDYRGRNLLPIMAKHLIDKYKGKYDDFFVAIAPTNIPSIKSFSKLNIVFLNTYTFVRCLKVTFNKYTIKNEI